MQPKTTFTRRGQESTPSPAPALPEGTRKSIHNGQLLVSTGLHDLDYIFSVYSSYDSPAIFGGGIAVGTLVLVEEDRTSSYYQSVFGYFLGEALATNQAIAICSASKSPEKILQSAPREVTSTPESRKEAGQHDLKIAWQYQKYLGGADLGDQGKQMSGQAWCHNYDLNRPIDPNSLLARQSFDHYLDLSKVIAEKSQPLLSVRCKTVYSFVCKLINEYNSKMAAKQGKILRIVIHALGSPSWGCMDPAGSLEILRLLHALRGLMRASLAVCMISMPTFLFDDVFVTKIRHIGDTVVRLESFADIEPEQVSPVFQDFDGMFHILKLPKLGTIARHVLEAGPKMTFAIKQKKLTIEGIYLPPEISRTTTSNMSEGELKEKQQQQLQKPSLLCQPGPPDKNVIDF